MSCPCGMIFLVKSPATLAVAVLFLMATVCAAACPQAIPVTSCHSESEQESEDTLCLEKDFLTGKAFVDGFVLPVVSVDLGAPDVTMAARVDSSPQVPFLVNLRSVV